MNDFFVQELKAKVILSDVISRYIKVINNGGKYTACCPFHKEKTPSFNINNEKGFYHCFGCNESGDAIKFLQQHLSLSFIDAIKELCIIAGVQMPQQKNLKNSNEINILQKASEKMQEYLLTSNSAKNYLKKRHITDDVIKKFEIGYGGEDGKKLYSHLLLFFSEEELMKSGIFIQSNTKSSIFNRFYNRIIFPIQSHSGIVVGFSGRIFNGEQNTGKYINSPETDIFKKSQILYNFHVAKKTKERFVIVTEGFMDVIAFYKDGISNAVAQMGTAFTKEHLQTLVSRFDEVVFCLDSDDAGILSQKKIIKLLFENIQPNLKFTFITMQNAKDPDEYLLKNGAGSLKNLLQTRKSLHEYMWNLWSKDVDLQNPESLIKLENNLNTVLEKTPLPAKKHYKNYFQNQIFNLKTQKNAKTPIYIENISTKYTIHEINTVAFFYIYHKKIEEINEQTPIEFEIYINNENIQSILTLIQSGADVASDEDLQIILKEHNVPELSNGSAIVKYYELLYLTSMISKINEEIHANKNNFKKTIFLSSEIRSIQKKIQDILDSNTFA